MSTPEQLAQDERDFAAAYESDEAQSPAGSEDEEFGLTPDSAEPTEPEAAPSAPVEEPTEDGPVVEQTSSAPRQLSAEEQRLKSWEGRLKARDAMGQSVEHEEPAQKQEEPEETPEEEAAETPTEEAAEAVAEKIKGMDPDEALAALANDFGEDFTSMLASIIDAKVAKATGNTEQTVQQLLAEMTDTKERQHFTLIASKHPDFLEVAQSQDFEAAIAALPDEKQAEVRQVIEQGSAKEIIDLLDGYKESVKAKSQQTAEDPPELDAAEGVRSGAVRLPTQPGAADDYAAAWDEA